jgi:hypothetical protein
LGIMDALVRKDRQFPTQDVRWSQSEVYRLGYQSAQKDR